MPKGFHFFGLVCAILLAVHAGAEPVQQSVAAELGFIKRVFEVGYAPAPWKKRHLNWTIEDEYRRAVEQIEAQPDVDAASYRRLISQVLRSAKDYHVGGYFLATEAASLPFQVAGANGKFFVVWVDSDKLDKNEFPIQVGDELVSWNGRPVQEVVLEVRRQIEKGVEGTDQRLAEAALTRRSAARGMDVPQGHVELVFNHSEAGKSKRNTRWMTWDYTPESLAWNPLKHEIKPLSHEKKNDRSSRLPQMTWPEWSVYSVDTPVHSFSIGSRKSYVPQLGLEIWRTNEGEKFDAYIYRTELGQLVGYVRIPSYSGDSETFKEFKKIIGKMQGATDALVIDQINNPGGSLFYLMALTSVLSDRPIKVPDHHVALWPALVNEVIDTTKDLRDVKDDGDARRVLGEDWAGYPIDYQFVQGYKEYARSVETAWKAKSHLTEPLHFEGVDKVNPDREVNYTKPILVLVNELDFSGGDFFPAILQDNQRAKIFGQRTSGAGGYVLNVQYPSSLGLAMFSFTGSLARRTNLQPIENLGVTPDILYTLTEKDLTEGFVDYKAAINKAVQDLLKDKMPSH